MKPTSKRKQTLSLLLALAGLVLFLIFFAVYQEQRGVRFAGSDERAGSLIEEAGKVDDGWFSGLRVRPDHLEGPLFALQAALGAGFVGYTLGYLRGRRREREEARGDY